MEDFRPGREGDQLTFSTGELFYQIDEGDRIIIVAGRGLLDWWYDDVRLPPTQEPASL